MILGFAGRDRIESRGGHDCLLGDRGDDVLRGELGNDRLTGGRGADTLAGGPGVNAYEAGPGPDFVDARNGRRELVRCGSGRDRARLDRRDRARSCERISRPGWRQEPRVLYMVVERFRRGAAPVYERAAEHGRLLPAGLTYVDSWIDERLDRCFQLMETDDRRLLDQWTARWSDLVDFEVVPVITSAEAAARVISSG